MKKPSPSWRPIASWVAAAGVLLSAESAIAQLPGAAPASGGGIPWQVAAMFTANWVLAAVAVAILSRPTTKRTEKPKKTIEEEA